MNTLQLTQSSLETCCSDLQSLAQKLTDILSAFQAAFTKLDAGWDGDAQEGFRDAYQRLLEQYTKVANEVAPAYVKSLQNIITVYSDNEAAINGKVSSL